MAKSLESPNAYPLLRAAVFSSWCVVALAYAAYRATTLDTGALAYSVLFYLAEIYALTSTMLFAVVTWRLEDRRVEPFDRDVDVDVFIPTKGEPLDVLRETIGAAMAMNGSKIVWVLDDSGRAEVEALAGALGARYLARGEAADAKAGNLNFGLRQTQAPFVAVLDADFVAAPEMLTALLGYFRDENCALVQAPQTFRNQNSFQHIPGSGLPDGWNEQSLWFDVIERGRAYWNATAYCGSPAMLRRSALARIGGFAIETVTEDAHTGLRLHKAGFACAYHPDTVAIGLAPETATAFMRQRMRWASGQYATLYRERLWRGGLTIGQWLCYFSSFQYFAGALRDAIFVLAPAVALFTGILPFYADTTVFLPLFLAQLFLSWAVMVTFSRGVWRVLPALHFDAAVLGPHLYSTLRAPFSRKTKFVVTPKDRRSGENWWLLVFPAAIAIGNAVAVGYAVFAVENQPFPAIQGWPLAIVSAWAAFTAMSHLSVVAKVLHGAFKNA